MEKEQILRKEEVTSPDFMDEIDPITVLEILESFCVSLREHPDEKELVQSIRKQLTLWEVITVDLQDAKRWVTHPISIQKVEIKRPIMTRIKHLLVSGGEWKSNRVDRNIIMAPNLISLPLSHVNPDTEVVRAINEFEPFLATLVHLYNGLLSMMKQGVPSLGIFEKANGVINMNRMLGWLNQHDAYDDWGMKHSLAVQNLCQLVDENIASFAQKH